MRRRQSLPLRAFCFVYRSNTCSSQVIPMSLLLQPVSIDVAKTSSPSACILATQLVQSVELLDAQIRLGGNAVPSAQIAARSVIHSREPSCKAPVTSFASHLQCEKTRLLRLMMPTAKFFSSTLYMLHGSMPYSLILRWIRSKQSLYLSCESALEHVQSSSVTHLEMRWSWFW
jgi:hypothetical protein